MQLILFALALGLAALWPQGAPAIVQPLSPAENLTLWQELIVYIREQQQIFHRELADAIRAVREGGLAAIWGLLVVSFLYGIFHAAGPGHGKAIITTYLMTHESQLKRGIFLSFASALVQGISALVIVGVFVWIVGWGSRDARALENNLETASFAMVALIGVYLIYRGLMAFWHKLKVIMQAPGLGAPIALGPTLPHTHDHSTHHHEHHHYDHHDHDHSHDHSHGSAENCQVCGHSHAPDPALLDGKKTLRETLMIVFSIGIRPCSGSVLVLVFAQIVGLHMAGIAAVFAVSFGTALTVSALAVFAVYFRKIAMALSDRSGHPLFDYVSPAMACMGGLVILLLGLSLLNQTLQNPHPLF